MKKTIWISVALTLLVIGCAPLQQAPLVYASKIAVGIDVSATSTETPGVSMSVGYKQVDAAYVPVAVAKQCDKNLSASCTEEMYKLLPIRGSFGSNGTSSSGPNEEEAKEALRKYNVELDKLNALRDAEDAAKRRIAALQSRQLELQTRQKSAQTKVDANPTLAATINDLQQKKAAGPLTPLEITTLNDSLEKQNAIDKEKLQPAELAELNGLAAAINLATTDYEKTSAAKVAAAPEVDKLKPKAAAANATLGNVVARTDAYSVYGRFESSTRTNNNTNGIAAGIELGKVFSTGVASQFLANGLAEYYRGLGLVTCYGTAGNLHKTTEDTALLKQMLAACASQASK